jgi:2-oxoacid:acceptor oxidoreductase gamma subunit (pyruvate/2-ketoisovalerate family)
VAKLTEIRWHARGGQGAKTASTFLAEAAIGAGKYSQGFPDYGPERMGAPMRGFTRISDTLYGFIPLLRSPILLWCWMTRCSIR